MHLIDYANRRDGVLYHGTVSNLDGEPKATWSYEKNGRKVTEDQPIDLPMFRSLWNRVGNLEVFKRNRVVDPNRPVDPDRDHVVTIIFGDKDEPKRAYFAIPAGETDPQFLHWIKSLNIPKGSAAPPEPPAKRARKSSPHRDERERIFTKFFGKEFTVERDSDPDGPPIDVFIFEPGEDARGRERDFYTLVTSGLSDAPMRVPKGVPFRRAELILYVDKPTQQHVGVLRFLARLPLIQEKTWYSFGTTMTNGRPPQPIFEDSGLDCYFFLEPVYGRDNTVHEKLEIDGDPTTMLWVVPITKAECDLILDESIGEFLNLLDRKKHPYILDEGRPSYVRIRR
jgi:hypothetical protein